MYEHNTPTFDVWHRRKTFTHLLRFFGYFFFDIFIDKWCT